MSLSLCLYVCCKHRPLCQNQIFKIPITLLLGGLYRCAKFGWNRCSTFDNMKVLIFYAFGLKTPIHAPKIGVLGRFDSLCRGQY